MFSIIGRLLPWLVIFGVWYYLNRRLDVLKDREDRMRAHPFWGKFYFLYGWFLGSSRFSLILRYLLTGIAAFTLMQWFFLSTSTVR